MHGEASTKFEEAKSLTWNEEAQRTLDVLSKQHLARSKFLNEQKNAIAAQRQEANNNNNNTRPAQSDDLAGSLASARGIPDGDRKNKSNTTNNTRPNSAANNSKRTSSPSVEDDPFYKFYQSINSVYSKSFQNAVSKEEANTNERQQYLGSTATLNSAAAGSNESFYVVPNTSSLTYEELITENASLRQLLNKSSVQLQAHETANKKQKDALKSCLIQLKNELSAKESAKNKEHDAETEELKSENDKLKIQIGRLKSRWDELKESARNRRKDDDGSTTNIDEQH